jgi:hypothetical protein
MRRISVGGIRIADCRNGGRRCRHALHASLERLGQPVVLGSICRSSTKILLRDFSLGLGLGSIRHQMMVFTACYFAIMGMIQVLSWSMVVVG